jgi:hypothetical protein
MLYRVLVPKEPTHEIPRGAALLETARGRGTMFLGRHQFGELCAKAIRQGRHVAIPADCIEIGSYEATDGELRARNGAASSLGRGRCSSGHTSTSITAEVKSPRLTGARLAFRAGG